MRPKQVNKIRRASDASVQRSSETSFASELVLFSKENTINIFVGFCGMQLHNEVRI